VDARHAPEVHCLDVFPDCDWSVTSAEWDPGDGGRRAHDASHGALAVRAVSLVDEGQDLLSMGSLEKLDAVLAGGLEKGQWCFFHDLNNRRVCARGKRGGQHEAAGAGPQSSRPSRARQPTYRSCPEFIIEGVYTVRGPVPHRGEDWPRLDRSFNNLKENHP
jgi:hypothetical protein